MAQLSPQLKWELLKFLDSSSIEKISSSFMTKYYWRQLVPEATTINEAIRVMALREERLDSRAIKLLDPGILGALAFTQRPDLWSTIVPAIKKKIKILINEDEEGDIPIQGLTSLFRVINIEQFMSLFPTSPSSPLYIHRIFRYLAKSGNNELFMKALPLLRNSPCYTLEQSSECITMSACDARNEKLLQLLEENHLLVLIQLDRHVNDHFTKMVLDLPANEIRFPTLLIKDLILHQKWGFLLQAVKKIPQLQQLAIFIMALCGYFNETLSELIFSEQHPPGSHFSPIIRVESVPYDQLLKRKIPENVISWAAKNANLAQGLTILAGIQGDIELMKKVIPHIGTDLYLFNEFANNYWPSMIPEAASLILAVSNITIFFNGIKHFPVNINTLTEQLVNITNVYNMENITSIQIARELMNQRDMNFEHFTTFSFLVQLIKNPHNISVEELRQLFSEVPLAENEAKIYPLYLREEIFLALPKEDQVAILGQLRDLPAEKIAYYKQLTN